MMDKKLRLKMITRLAQAAAAPTTSVTTTTTTTPTPTVSGNNTIVAPPPQLSVWSAYPAPIKSYSPAQITIINGLVARLSNAVNQLTSGKYNFQALRDSTFHFDPSEFSDPDTKNLMLFFGKVFKFLLNNGIAFSTNPINPQQLTTIISSLMNAPELANLSQVNPVGAVANQAPGNNTLFSTIRNTLQMLQPASVIKS
jgi:hypothetical protein